MTGVVSRAHRKLQQLHDELTECPVCLIEFSLPKQLPCMHTFCVDCLRRMTARRGPGDRIPCPICTQPFTIPHGGVDALPKNFVVDRLVELLRTSSIQCEPDKEYKPNTDFKYVEPVSSRPPEHFEVPAIARATPLTGPMTSDTAAVTSSETIAKRANHQYGAIRLFKDPVIFRSVDQHVCDVTSSEHSTVRELIWHLIFARDITNELEKARVLFRWLCTVDSNNLRFDSKLSAQRGAPEEVLTRFKDRRATFSEIFRKLCELVDLRCETIAGRVKGAIGRPAAASTPSSSFQFGRHSWSAIEVNGGWYLIDCTWAASSYEKAARKARDSDNVDSDKVVAQDAGAAGVRSKLPLTSGTRNDDLTSTKTTANRRKEWQRNESKQKNLAATDEEMTSGQDGDGFNGSIPTEPRQQPQVVSPTADYYFMTDPAQMIFTHLPDDARWQLLEHPIGAGEFDQMVGAGAAFHTFGLRLIGLQSSRALVKTALSEVVLRIGCPENRLIVFTTNLSVIEAGGKLVNTVDRVHLNRYVMHETIDNIAHFRVRLPNTGTYRLTLYACDVTSNTKRIGKLTFEGVCDYCLLRECDNAATVGLVRPYPQCKMTSWGSCLGPDGQRLRPLLKSSMFHCNRDGVAELRFRFSDDLNHEMMKFTARLKDSSDGERQLKADSVDTDLNGCVLSRVVGPACDIAAFTIRVPSAGEYGLEIYTVMSDDDAGGDDDARDVYRLQGQYLIVCKENPPGDAILWRYPKLPPGFLGPQPMFHKLGLSVISHVDPYVQLPLHTGSDSIYLASRAELRIVIGTTINITSKMVLIDEDRATAFHFDEYVLQQRFSSHRIAHETSISADDGDDRRVRVEFVVRVPKPGVYRLQIYAIIGSMNDEDTDLNGSAATVGSSSSAAESLAPVYNYVIDARLGVGEPFFNVAMGTANKVRENLSSAGDVTKPFPHQTNLWRTDGCVLHAPLDGRLVIHPLRKTSPKLGENEKAFSENESRRRTFIFRVELPQRVDKVAVVVSGSQWSYLERKPSTGTATAGNSHVQLNMWQGQVQMPVVVAVGGSESGAGQGRRDELSTGSVEVCAHYSKDSASYRTLLEYTLVT